MVDGQEVELAMPLFDDSGYLSDESAFYGDETTRQELEDRAETFDPAHWWKSKHPFLTDLADAGVAAKMEKATSTLYNPYEGRISGHQSEETVDEFLQRLPPATTRISHDIPWIFIANPFRKRPAREMSQDQMDLGDEGPPSVDSDWATFVVQARNLLKQLTCCKHAIEKGMAGEANAAVTRAVNVEKENIVRRILDTAAALHCTSGKWMIFCASNEVNAVWSVVAHATAQNVLGTAAKVAPDNGQGRDRLVCVYTNDFNDVEDVTRVIVKMKTLGLVEPSKALYYKCDAYTYLGLNANNDYNIKISLYNSKDVLAGETENEGQKTLDGLLYRRQPDSGGWQELETW